MIREWPEQDLFSGFGFEKRKTDKSILIFYSTNAHKLKSPTTHTVKSTQQKVKTRN